MTTTSWPCNAWFIMPCCQVHYSLIAGMQLTLWARQNVELEGNAKPRNLANLSTWAKLLPDSRRAAHAWRLLPRIPLTLWELQNFPAWPAEHFHLTNTLVPYRVCWTVVPNWHPGWRHFSTNNCRRRSREQITFVPTMRVTSFFSWFWSSNQLNLRAHKAVLTQGTGWSGVKLLSVTEDKGKSDTTVCVDTDDVFSIVLETTAAVAGDSGWILWVLTGEHKSFISSSGSSSLRRIKDYQHI